MVSGIGPKETLDRYGIPVLTNRPGVGQGMWACEILSQIMQPVH